jgi:RNase P subunit RPR2
MKESIKVSSEQGVCHRCGAVQGSTPTQTGQAASDPLVVSECSSCGAIVGIGGHQW